MLFNILVLFIFAGFAKLLWVVIFLASRSKRWRFYIPWKWLLHSL